MQPLKATELNETKPCPAPSKTSFNCFPSKSQVQTLNRGILQISDLKEGDYIKTLDLATGKSVFSKFVTYLHQDKEVQAEFIKVQTKNEKFITLTEKHLIPRLNVARNKAEFVFANRLKLGDFIICEHGNEEIEIIEWVEEKGVYAPLTESGTVLVDEILASCYANIEQHYLAHWVFKPYVYFKRFLDMIVLNFRAHESDKGLNGYARFLMDLVRLSD